MRKFYKECSFLFSLLMEIYKNKRAKKMKPAKVVKIPNFSFLEGTAPLVLFPLLWTNSAFDFRMQNSANISQRNLSQGTRREPLA